MKDETVCQCRCLSKNQFPHHQCVTMSEMDEAEVAEVAENVEIADEALNDIIMVVAAATQAADAQVADENLSENGSESSVNSLEEDKQTILRNYLSFTDSDLVLVSRETLIRFLQETRASTERREMILARRVVLLRIAEHERRLREYAEERALLNVVSLELAQRELNLQDRPPPQ